MNNALILGGSGFVGRYLSRELTAHGYSVTLTTTGEPPAEPDCCWVTLDILNPEAVSALLSEGKFDCVFHLAAQSSAAVSWKKPALTMDINIKGTANLLEALRSMDKPPRLLFVGSSEEYGPVKAEDCPLHEEQPLHPANPYAVSKRCAEELCLLYASAYGLDLLCTRSFNHVGPGQGRGFVLSDFCRQIAEIEQSGGSGTLRVGNLSAKRDFTDVRDVVRAYRLLMEKGRTGEVYNVGSGRALAVEELLAELLKLAAVPVAVEVDPAKFRPVDVPLHMAAVEKIKKDTLWVPEISLKQTLSDTLNDWRSQSRS